MENKEGMLLNFNILQSIFSVTVYIYAYNRYVILSAIFKESVHYY